MNSVLSTQDVSQENHSQNTKEQDVLAHPQNGMVMKEERAIKSHVLDGYQVKEVWPNQLLTAGLRLYDIGRNAKAQRKSQSVAVTGRRWRDAYRVIEASGDSLGEYILILVAVATYNSVIQ